MTSPATPPRCARPGCGEDQMHGCHTWAEGTFVLGNRQWSMHDFVSPEEAAPTATTPPDCARCGFPKVHPWHDDPFSSMHHVYARLGKPRAPREEEQPETRPPNRCKWCERPCAFDFCSADCRNVARDHAANSGREEAAAPTPPEKLGWPDHPTALGPRNADVSIMCRDCWSLIGGVEAGARVRWVSSDKCPECIRAGSGTASPAPTPHAGIIRFIDELARARTCYVEFGRYIAHLETCGICVTGSECSRAKSYREMLDGFTGLAALRAEHERTRQAAQEYLTAQTSNYGTQATRDRIHAADESLRAALAASRLPESPT